MFGIKTKGKRNWPMIIGLAGAGTLVYLFIATRIVKPAPAPAGAGVGAAHPAAAMAAASGAPPSASIDSAIAGVAGGTGNFNYPSGIRGIPGGYGIAGGYATRAYDAFPYQARLAVS
jgi:hypothetical protein